jgi:uncharacterized protein YdhG (YjbR/CyaY superfamily)
VKKTVEVDAYIAHFPPAVRARLTKIRRAVHAAAPRASEGMSYRIPAYRQHNIIVYFAGFQKHIGMFPPVRGDARLEKAVARYAGPKGNLKFPHDAPFPLPLIARIARHQAKQDAARAAARKKRK